MVLLLLVGITAVTAVHTRLACLDAAREAALLTARGGSGTVAAHRVAPDGARIEVTVDGDAVVATVTAPVPVLGLRLPAWTVSATSVAAVEPGSAGPVS